MFQTRRSFLSSLLTLSAALTAHATSESDLVTVGSLHRRLAKIESQRGGRLGVALFQPHTARVLGYRLDERFPMCSTFKVLTVAAVLARVDHGQESLERSVSIREADILRYAPVTSQHVGMEGMSVSELCAAALTLSDNTAANLLINTLKGPEAVTAFARSIGDSMTRLDRLEPDLNEAAPGDVRDTTTPRAMVHDLSTLLCGTKLTDSSRSLLKEWMVNSKTGVKEIRSTLPADYLVGDKTGSGGHNTSNDIAVIWPPAQPPFALAIFLTNVRTDSSDTQATIIAEVARTCLSSWLRSER